jgi:hypothetical protein
MSVGTGPEGLRHRRRGLGRSLRSRTRNFLPFSARSGALLLFKPPS